MKLRDFKTNIMNVADGHKVEFFIANYNHLGYLHVEIAGERLAQINTHEAGVFTVVLNNKLYEMLSLSQVTLLIDYIEKFANTPLDERVEEKKYYIKFMTNEPEDSIRNNVYINYDIQDKNFFINDRTQSMNVKTKFTWNEIEEFGLMKFLDSELFKVVEV